MWRFEQPNLSLRIDVSFIEQGDPLGLYSWRNFERFRVRRRKDDNQISRN
jgi:hypothetical protein